MTKTPKRYTITSALTYANGPIHIGHLAGVFVPSDIYARYLRLAGHDVHFLGGSDEHGVPITIRAKKEGKTPQHVVDKYHKMIEDSLRSFGVSFDVYSRTSSEIHHETASNFFRKLYEEGKFIEQTSEQYYDPKEKQFLSDRYIVGTCPKCGNENAYGDQCEKCGSSLSPNELIDPRSTLSGEKPVLKETKHWYLPLNEYEPWLKEWILEGHKEWKSNVYGQCKSWIEGGLQPRAVTRDLDWGIPVPVEGAEGKVLYVWFDAPIGYISASKEWSENTGKDWEPYWKNDDTKLVHFIGKDNIVFHCIIFPSMLKANGEYILPENVPANEFLNLEGDKISTSRNWAIWLHEYLEDFSGKEDVLRYVICANAPETKDNNFTWNDFQARNNNELVAILGNFVNRAAVLTQKYYEGEIPAKGELSDFDKEVIEGLKSIPYQIGSLIESYKFREATQKLMDLARLGNKYLADTEPWKLIKEDPERVKTIMNIALQITASLAVVMEPFLPFSSDKLKEILNIKDGKFSWANAGDSEFLKAGHKLNKPSLLFEKIEDKIIEEQMSKLEAIREENQKENAPVTVEPLKSEIEFDDFMKLDIRVGTVLEAEKMPKSKKLLKLKIDTGVDTRIVLSGIAQHFTPEEVIGKQVCVLANLKPRNMMGIESNGMVLMAEDSEGNLRFIQPGEEVNPGSTVS
ncbi:methionine--tRNA ligase [Marinigracilibium pacificum]|uniref:Methionine--tRNA ligase n=1 Tax=Marinigracilibium pacificum TaxID=2729599 RepID=A0A848IZP9_9BACT|nr:methionine--tRNA ligase [Marinigracilibium pacificum]NMM49086.1 methionine--tRNA ligase [Marinigracilibium pacificum]